MTEINNANLIFRTLTDAPADHIEKLTTFYVETFKDAGDTEADTLGDWTMDLIERNPSTTTDDFLYVYDEAHDKIASALLLIPQTWMYGDVEIGVGRVEIVATDPDYRRRGLVGELMNRVHERSEQLGHLMQSITGIPYFYRQFGYAMTMDLGSSHYVSFSEIPPLKDDESPRFTLQLATEADIPALIQIDDAQSYHFLMRTKRTQADWEMEFKHTKGVPYEVKIALIVNTDNQTCGYVVLGTFLSMRNTSLYTRAFYLDAETSYIDIFNDVFRALPEFAKEHMGFENVNRVSLPYGIHPTLSLMLDRSIPRATRNPYKWYIRVGDVAKFILAIKHILEERIEHSGVHGYTGELKIGFYERHHLEINFENGKITNAEHVLSEKNQLTHANFPFNKFLDLLFAQESVMDLYNSLPDLWIGRNGAALLDVMFPKLPSSIYEIG